MKQEKRLVVLSAVVVLLAGCRASPPATDTARIASQIDRGQRISADEIRSLEALGESHNTFKRAKAVTILSYAKQAEAHEAASALARRLLTDREWLVRHAALNAMRRMHLPDTQQAARRMTRDASRVVRQSAEKIVKSVSP